MCDEVVEALCRASLSGSISSGFILIETHSTGSRVLVALPFADHISNRYANHDNYHAPEYLRDQI